MLSDGGSAMEMTSRPRSSSGDTRGVSSGQSYGENYAEWEGGVRRSNTTGKKIGNRLSKRFGSLRMRKGEEQQVSEN